MSKSAGGSSANMDDALLRARVEDAVRLSEQRSCPRFVGFLDERQRQTAQTVLRAVGCVNARFFGGHDEAERTLLGVFPSFMEPEDSLFPLTAVGFAFRKGVSLSHRDFLGTLLSCGVKREKIGDILCADGLAVVFADEDIAPYLCEQIDRVRGEGVSLTCPFTGELPVSRNFQELRDTVASPRLDAVVKVAVGISREEAARRIAAGLVSLNHAPCLSVSAPVKAGDLLSIRGEGRFLVETLGPPTRKGRLFLTIQKYL